MNKTAALPLVAAAQIATSCSNAETGNTLRLLYVMCSSSSTPSNAATISPAPVEEFKLTDDEVAGFYSLNANPPTVAPEVFELFRGKLAQS